MWLGVGVSHLVSDLKLDGGDLDIADLDDEDGLDGDEVDDEGGLGDFDDDEEEMEDEY